MELLKDQQDRIIQNANKIIESGEFPNEAVFKQYYAAFQSRFGPEILQGLDGRTLLYTLFDFSDHNSLGYWLEYKDDDEFKAVFGSIAGGSALKYGIFKRRETGEWTIGIPRKPQVIPEAEAIAIARKYRDPIYYPQVELSR